MGVKPATVVNYIVKALCTDADLPYDNDRLRELIKGITIRNDQLATLDQLLEQGSCKPANNSVIDGSDNR
jgi:hypothetical protein